MGAVAQQCCCATAGRCWATVGIPLIRIPASLITNMVCNFAIYVFHEYGNVHLALVCLASVPAPPLALVRFLHVIWCRGKNPVLFRAEYARLLGFPGSTPSLFSPVQQHCRITAPPHEERTLILKTTSPRPSRACSLNALIAASLECQGPAGHPSTSTSWSATSSGGLGRCC